MESIEAEIVDHYRELRAYAFALTHDEDAAADLVQHACERAVRMRSSFGPGANLVAWLKRVMRNLFIDEYRNRRRFQPLGFEPEVDAPGGESPAFADLLTLSDAKAGIRGMRDHDRVILELALLDGVAYRDISTQLGVLPKTVGTRVFRAKEKLRRHLEGVFEQRLAELHHASA